MHASESSGSGYVRALDEIEAAIRAEGIGRRPHHYASAALAALRLLPVKDQIEALGLPDIISFLRWHAHNEPDNTLSVAQAFAHDLLQLLGDEPA